MNATGVTTGVTKTAGSVVILAAGQGKRMHSAKPKVLHPLCGRPMIAWVVDQARALRPERIVVVVGHGGDLVRAALEKEGLAEGLTFVRQEPQHGTGHALQCCVSELGVDPGITVVLYGDMPLLRPESLTELLNAHADDASNGAAVLTATPDDPTGFGRIVRSDDLSQIERIVEHRDATSEECRIGEINSGVYAFEGRALLAALPRLSNQNAQREYYLTDVMALFKAEGRPVIGLELVDLDEAIGVNNLSDLAQARWALQMRILEEHMVRGVQIEDPATTYIDHGVTIGVGARILPCTVIRSGVVVGAGCEVGPFTHLRAGTVLEDGAEIGNFTECKNAHVGEHAKAKHLAYLGDVTIGAKSNIGAGTIFANYDGVAKHRCTLGKGVFVGSGTVVVAPNTIGDGATTGAGAIVARDTNIGADELWLGVPARRRTKASRSDERSVERSDDRNDERKDGRA